MVVPRTPFARFSPDMLSPKIDVAENKDAIDVMASTRKVPKKKTEASSPFAATWNAAQIATPQRKGCLNRYKILPPIVRFKPRPSRG
jgi:hypothetical protein